MDERERLKILGKRVQHYRQLKNISVETLAEQVNCSASHLQKFESVSTISSISLSKLFRICDALDIPLSKLTEDL